MATNSSKQYEPINLTKCLTFRVINYESCTVAVKFHQISDKCMKHQISFI